MFILKCKVNETVLIGNDIRVTVLHMGRRGMRLGFEAPDDIPISRDLPPDPPVDRPASAAAPDAVATRKWFRP